MTDKIDQIYTDQIDDPAAPMRGELDREQLHELADNIKQNGLINPITIRPIWRCRTCAKNIFTWTDDHAEHDAHEAYEVVAGHRRLSACKIAGLIKIPCVIRELNDQKTFEVMAAENLERADVDPVEEAVFLKNYALKTGKDVPEIARSIKRSVNYVLDRLSIAEMPDYMQVFLKDKKISIGVALELMKITDEDTRSVWCQMAARDGVSVQQARFWYDGWKLQELPGGVRSPLPPEGFKPGETAPVMFECEIDGLKHNAKNMRTVMIFEDHLPFLNAMITEFRKGSFQ